MTRLAQDGPDPAPLSNSLFQSPWWLDLVAPGMWGEVVAQRQGTVVGRWPYVVKHRYGLRSLGHPPLTQTLGPVIRTETAAGSVDQALEDDVMGELADALPRVAFARHVFAPEMKNWYPLYLRGYRSTVRYTYRLAGLARIEEIEAKFAKNLKRDVRQAGGKLTLDDQAPASELVELIKATYARQGRQAPIGEALVTRVVEGVRAKGAGVCLIARDASGRPHAGGCVVWDERCAYWIMAGADPELRRSGAGPLVLATAIRRAAAVAATFDFEGSMVPPIAAFFRRFGGALTPVLMVEGAGRLVGAALAARGVVGALLGRTTIRHNVTQGADE